MLKKIVITSSILALTSTVALANSAPYIGAGLGLAVNTSNSGYFGYNRVAPVSLFAGYGGVIAEDFYLAGEITGTIGSFELTDHGSLKTTYGYGASIIPGVMLSDHTMAFGRLGLVGSYFSDASSNSSHGGKNQAGAQFGLGLQTGLTQHIDLRGEYDFNTYRSIKVYGYSVNPRSDVTTASLVYKFD